MEIKMNFEELNSPTVNDHDYNDDDNLVTEQTQERHAEAKLKAKRLSEFLIDDD